MALQGLPKLEGEVEPSDGCETISVARPAVLDEDWFCGSPEYSACHK